MTAAEKDRTVDIDAPVTGGSTDDEFAKYFGEPAVGAQEDFAFQAGDQNLGDDLPSPEDQGSADTGKKSQMVTVITSVVAVLIFVGMGYLQFGGKGAPRQEQAVVIPLSSPGSVPATTQMPVPAMQEAAPLPWGAPEEASAQPQIPAMEQPLAGSPQMGGADSANPLTPAPSGTGIPAFPEPLAAAPAPTATPAPVMAPADSSMISAPAPVSAPAPTSAPAAAETTNLQPVLDRLAEMDVRLKEITTRLETLEKAKPEASAAAPAPVKPEAAAAPEKAEEVAPAKTEKAPVKKTVKKTKSKSKSAVKTTARTSTWQLRSATPGAALVAQGPGGELKRVAEGDTLSGIGKVTAIHQVAGRWVVEGTQGSIRQ